MSKQKSENIVFKKIKKRDGRIVKFEPEKIAKRAWEVKRTETFLVSLKAIKNNRKALEELGKKIKRLQEDPLPLGGWLSGALHGKKSTRITKKYRLIFTPDETEKVVYLNWIDHRKRVY